MDMNATAASTQSNLGLPETDPCPFGGHDPHCLVGPALDHRKPEHAGVKLLGCGQVVLLERDLADTGHWNGAIARHCALLISPSPHRPGDLALGVALGDRLTLVVLPLASSKAHLHLGVVAREVHAQRD